jgi:epoxyqueuosine reductase QueG
VEKIIEQSREWGVEYIGFVSATHWANAGDVPAALKPQAIWPPVKTVIVLAAPLSPAAIDAPGIAAVEPRVVRDMLDKAAYRLAVWLNQTGWLAVNIASDSSGEYIPDLKTVPVFSHAWAGHYAGLGVVDPDGTLVNRHRLPLQAVSVFTTFTAGAVAGEAAG